MRFVKIVPCLLAVVAGGSAAPAALTPSTPIHCSPPVSRNLRVHLINEAGAAPEMLNTAQAEAATIWASAGVRLTWTSPPVPLDLRDPETIVVIVRPGVARPPAADHSGSARDSHPPLGWLMFDDGRPGNLIIVSFDALTSIVMRASELGKPIPALPRLAQMTFLGRGLGRVVAHEIGHWLMGPEHTQEGLMRASFDADDLLELQAPRLPRACTAAGSHLRLALASHCELYPFHPATRQAASRHAGAEDCNS